MEGRGASQGYGPPARSASHQECQSSSKTSRKSSAPRQQPSHVAEELQFAKRTLQKLVQDSLFFPLLDQNNRVQTIKESDLDFGAIIGKGGFCEVRRASTKYSAAWGQQPHPGQSANNAAAAIATPKYAMKYLSPSKTTSSRVFQRGIADLAMEACFLSLLQHENIIRLHYVSEGSLEENYNCAPHQQHSISDQHQEDEIVMDAHGNLQLRRSSWHAAPPPAPPSGNHHFGYFLLLDTLHETLTDKIDRTYVPQVMNQSSSHSNNKMWDRIRHKTTTQPTQEVSPKVQLSQRLEIVQSVASALKYLHDDCRIIFRDIKPDNIGIQRRYHPQCTCGCYQSRGHRDGCNCYDEITKLFDFGLAKELKQKYRQTHPAYPDQVTFKLTGCTGSRRYMAPEVCFSDPYNQKADVYSFGMLLYQVASLVTPFDGFNMGKHEREVLRGGYRPDVRIPNSSFLKKGKKTSSRMQDEPMLGGGDEEDTERRNMLLASKTKRCWPRELPRLMEECWDYDMRYRPDMKDATFRLERCIGDLRNPHKSHSMSGHWPKFNTIHTRGDHMETSSVSSGSGSGSS